MTGTAGRPETCSVAFGSVGGPAKCRIRQRQEQVCWHECVVRYGHPAAHCPGSGAEQEFGEQFLYGVS